MPSIESGISYGLLRKLSKKDICVMRLKWLQSYFSGRKISILSGQIFQVTPINISEPQGSIMGPLILNFLIFYRPCRHK